MSTVNPQVTVRRSNLELLRIVGMVLIVAQHYQSDRVFEYDESGYPKHLFNETFMNFMSTGGKVGVNIFLLISGYFFKDQGMKPASLIRTWFQTVNWSYLIFFAEWLRRPMWPDDIKTGLLPVTHFAYWYISTYIAAMLLSPGTALAAKELPESKLITMIISLFVIMCVLGWGTYHSYCNIQWFLFVALIGASIRRFEPRIAKISTRKLKIALAILLLVNYGSVIYFTANPYAEYARTHGGPGALTRENNSKLALYIGIVAFLLALRLELYSEAVNHVSGCTLGVYLIHENTFFKVDIWNTFVDTKRYQNHPFFILHALVSVFSVYAGCSLLEYFRQKVFNPAEQIITNVILKCLNRLGERITQPTLSEEKNSAYAIASV